MNCAKHTDVPAEAYCRTCGTALCAGCKRDVQGTVYCENCLAERLNPGSTRRTTGAAAAPAAAAPAVVVGEGSPGLAALLGFIPGVGAMYNGQFTKGFIHVLVFATLIWITEHGFDLGGLFIAAWMFYMVFDAYTTAKARRYGLPIPDPLGLNRMFGANEAQVAQRVVMTGERIGEGVQNTVNAAQQQYATYQQAPVAVEELPEEPQKRVPVGAYVLIGLGFLFLLENLGILGFHWMQRFWPVILIAVGVWLFIRRRQAYAG